MYLGIKVVHLVSLVAWFAGLFYIFRLFVYHRREKGNEALCAVFSEMERKLLKIITLPASILTLLSGIGMLVLFPGWLSQPWFHVKMIGVLALFSYQALAIHTQRRFSRGDFFLSERSCRMINELPTVALILNVSMAVLKPWSG